MDRSEVRRIALLGAAKVAFSAALVGCGGVAPVSEPGRKEADGDGGTTPVPWQTPPRAGTTATITTNPAASAAPPSGATCQASSRPPIDAKAVECCQRVLATAFRQSGPAGQATPSSPDLVACCDLALTVRDDGVPGAPPAGTFDFSTAYQCCSVPGIAHDLSTRSCSPWGPPAPPSLPAGLDWLTEVA